MTKLTIAAILICCILSRKNSQTESKFSVGKQLNVVHQGRNANSKFLKFFKGFIEAHLDMCNNVILENETTEEFLKSLEQEVSNGILSDLPLTFLDVKQDKFNYSKTYKKNIATFVTDVASKDSAYRAVIYINSVVSDSIARTLKEYANYNVTGTYKFTMPDFAVAKYLWKPCSTEGHEYTCHEVTLKLETFSESPGN